MWEKQPARIPEKAYMVIGDCRRYAAITDPTNRTNGSLSVGRTKHPSHPDTDWCGEQEPNWELLTIRGEASVSHG